ncbi:hypothetical protein [Chromobacterium phragmitis]|uniref:Uncharacterized protein n=1 Tax=Chromobacterium phragmitis TaxID=2202141 RepID=A0A344UCE4_9NEIS|nr:hypothetical protein [Chromobacterium phragmitis]AXE32942.1 hypothetical protein DK843_00625 [Chromobacterium phragmitis]
MNQQTLEEASALMISVSKADLEYHEECLSVFVQALRASETDADFVISCINKSGYWVGSAQEAKDLLQEFRSIYIREFWKATGSTA